MKSSVSARPSTCGADEDAEEDLGDHDRQPGPLREVGEHRREHGDRGDDEDVAVIELQTAASLFAAAPVSGLESPLQARGEHRLWR